MKNLHTRLMCIVCTLFSFTTSSAFSYAKGKPLDANQYIQQVDKDLRVLQSKGARAEWIKSNFITRDTEAMAADANDALLGYIRNSLNHLQSLDKSKASQESLRQLHLLKVSNPVISPSDTAKRKQLTELAAKLEGMYGSAKVCDKNNAKTPCKTLGDLEDILKTSRNEQELKKAWIDWYNLAAPMRPLYQQLVTLMNEGAHELDFQDTGELWRSGYDMSPAQFSVEADRLWNQVSPLYTQLHCYVRGQLQKEYGKSVVKDQEPIPAHLLGNMWAQQWDNLYDFVKPHPKSQQVSIDRAIQAKHWTAKDMVRQGEAFFLSLGFDKLPSTFYELSLFEKPRDRDVVCHASAWDMDYNGDLRIKMCIKPNEEDLTTIHHELGHIFYYQTYEHLPVLFQQGANDGFHEAIGDTIALSVTSEYYKKLGLLRASASSQETVLNDQMKRALDKIAFLPFGRRVDQWRWDVFAGKTTSDHYTKDWWALARKYQGIAPPVSRSESEFDPGAKYHVPANVPYARYFLATILQFQFHKSLCQAAGHKGPLYTCSIYGSKEAGEKLKSMLSLGASQPWQIALEKITGSQQMDASALLEYFEPLNQWLKQQNAHQKCGW